MCVPASVMDMYAQNTYRNLSLSRIPSIFHVLDRLYWDCGKRSPRKLLAHPKTPIPGDLSTRLPRRLDQLELTYDLHSLSADRLIELLGPEFQALDHGGTASAPAAKAKPAKRRRIPVTVG